VACGGGAESAPTVAQAQALLSAHAKALHDRDRDAFLAAVSTSARSDGFRQAQADEFDNLARLPLVSWSYAVDGPITDAGLRSAATKRYGTPALIVNVTVRYELARGDAVPTQRSVFWTFVHEHGHVVVAGDDDVSSQAGTSWRGPWDFGHLQIVQGRSSLVLGHDDTVAVLPSLAADIDRAVPAVTAVWGRGWSQNVVAIVPDSKAEATANSGSSTSPDDLAAQAVNDGTDPLTERTRGPRLLVTADQLSRLSPTGRQIVLRHEIAHIASFDATSEATPTWLREGFAEFVANLGTGQPTAAVAAELRAAVRAGKAPSALPGDAQFSATPTQAAQAYEEAWLACRLIAQRVGPAGLVRFYRTVGGQLATASDATAAGMRAVLHESPATFTTQWRAYLHTELG
jgi:hypothetical protein